MNATFNIEKFIYFNQADIAGILYFQKVFDLSHHCLEEFINQTDITWNSWFSHPEYAVPIVHTSANYSSPIKAGSKVHIALSISKIGKSSLDFDFYISQDNKKCCEVKTTHVFINKLSQKSILIPECIKKNLSSKVDTNSPNS